MKILYACSLILLLVISLLVFPAMSFCATYYVSTSGNDSNAGTSGSPWAHCPGMSGWTGSATLDAGDTVYLNNADTWTASGGSTYISATGGVVYDGETWGAGSRAKITVTGGYSVAVLYIGSDHATITTEIIGFEVDCNNQNTSGANINWPTSNYLTGATKRFKNIEIYGINGSGSAKYGAKAGAIGGDRLENIEYVNMNIHDLNTTGIAIYPAVNCPTCNISNVFIDGCTIGPNIDGTAFTGAGTGIILKNNIDNAVVQNNTITDAVTNNLLIQDDGSGCTNGLMARWNTIYAANGDHGLAFQCLSTGINNKVYGNKIYGNPKAGIRFETNNTGSGHGVYVYNNSMYNNGSAGFAEISVTTAGSYSTLEFKNNIIYSNQGQLCLDIDAAGDVTAHQNNIYYRSTGNLVDNGGSTYTSATINSWEASADSSDPAYTTLGATPDLTLQSGSPAIDAGSPITTTTSAGSGTQMQVSDARFFLGPYGSRVGDTVQLIGQVTTATITAVNYSTNIISLNTPLSWSSGQGVVISYSGAALDMGAEEYSTAPGGNDPVVTITSPTSSATYNTTEATVTVGGSSTDADGTIASVGWTCAECTPTSGSATANDGAFDENSDPWTSASISLGDGTNVITMTVTDNSAATGTDTLTVYKGQGGVIEAEDCTLAGNMTSTADATASGGYYISTSATDTGTATCSVVISSAGYYKFYGNVYTSGVGDNSFFVMVNETASTNDTYAWDINAEENAQLWSTYYEEEISKRGTGAYNNPEEDPLVVYLTAATHNVIIGGREANTRLDYIYPVLLPNPQSDPTCTITSPTTLDSITYNVGSAITIRGSSTDDGTIASGAYSVVCNGAAFDSGSITCDDGTCDEAAETWSVAIGELPIGSCAFTVYTADNGANTSNTEILSFTMLGAFDAKGTGNISGVSLR